MLEIDESLWDYLLCLSRGVNEIDEQIDDMQHNLSGIKGVKECGGKVLSDDSLYSIQRFAGMMEQQVRSMKDSAALVRHYQSSLENFLINSPEKEVPHGTDGHAKNHINTDLCKCYYEHFDGSNHRSPIQAPVS